jgi:PhzF family phenazine biosynthesis protein
MGDGADVLDAVQRVASFSDGERGGNPAGVWIGDTLPDAETMARVAKAVGFSETVFAAPLGAGWRVRYFAPEAEVAFCGHATIALGAVLGEGVHALTLNAAAITVEGARTGDTLSAALMSPPTWSQPLPPEAVSEYLTLFGYSGTDLDPRIPPARIHAGADHVILALSDRARLATLDYDLEQGRALMAREGLTTILLLQAEDAARFHARNAFAIGGVVEDPATGSAAAALGGYLRDLDWPLDGAVTVIQGEDMGMRSILRVEITDEPGASIRVSGTTRAL